MSGNNSFWLVGDAPPSQASPTPTTDSSPYSSHEFSGSDYCGLHLTTSTTRSPPALVAIHPDSSISWAPASSQHFSGNPASVVGGKAMHNLPPRDSAQHVSVVQHIPSTHQQHYNAAPPRNELVLADASCSNHLVTSSTSRADLPEVPTEPVNYRPDVKMDDKALVIIDIKDLNRRLKKQGIGKERQKEIKGERRTLKNRGYASNCRVGREEEVIIGGL